MKPTPSRFKKKPGFNKGPRGRGNSSDERGGRMFRKKINRFNAVFPQNTTEVDFKDSERLSKFITEKGKIVPRRMSGMTAKQQRILARAVKRARHAGLLPFQSA